MRKFLSFILMTVISILYFCSQQGAQAVTPLDTASEVIRDTSPHVSDNTINKLVVSNTQFGLDIYDQLITEEEGNLFFSPYSLSVALAMTYAGASGQTKQQMADVLHFQIKEPNLHPAFNSISLTCDRIGQSASGADGKPFQLNVVNAIWGQQSYSFLDPFVDTLASHYGAPMRLLDFVAETEKSRLTINQWVSDQTEDNIKELIPKNVITVDTRLVLTNAIYFDAAWKHIFNPALTSERTFYLLDGNTVSVPMMNQRGDFGYYKGDNFEALELLYDGDEVSMCIIMPAEGEFQTFQSSMNAQTLKEISNTIHECDVQLSMPKWNFRSQFMLSKVLKAMGMKDAFTPAKADFSKMDGTTDLFLTDVIHEAFVRVNEKGTVAGAATAVLAQIESMPIPFKINRPFIFFIKEKSTNTLLFLGRVMNPLSE